LVLVTGYEDEDSKEIRALHGFAFGGAFLGFESSVGAANVRAMT
jgi:hypothetical protein